MKFLSLLTASAYWCCSVVCAQVTETGSAIQSSTIPSPSPIPSGLIETQILSHKLSGLIGTLSSDDSAESISSEESEKRRQENPPGIRERDISRHGQKKNQRVQDSFAAPAVLVCVIRYGNKKEEHRRRCVNEELSAHGW